MLQGVAGVCRVLHDVPAKMLGPNIYDIGIFMTFNVCLACVLQSVAVFALCHSVLQGVAAPFP